MSEVFWKDDKDPNSLKRRADDLLSHGLRAMAQQLSDRASMLELRTAEHIKEISK